MITKFHAWMKALGLNLQQVSRAGALIGLQTRTASAVRTGRRELSETELLAMSAVRAGLPPWSEKDDEMLEQIRASRGIPPISAGPQVPDGKRRGRPPGRGKLPSSASEHAPPRA